MFLGWIQTTESNNFYDKCVKNYKCVKIVFKQDTPRLGVQNVDCGKEKGICKTCIDREGAILWEVWEGGGRWRVN